MDFFFSKKEKKQKEEPPKINIHDPQKKKEYGRTKVFIVRSLYLLSIIAWLLIIWLLRINPNNLFGYFLLILPVIVFTITIIFASQFTVEIEESMFGVNVLSLGVLIILPLLTWMHKDFAGDVTQFMAVVLSGVSLTLIASIDIWVPLKWLSVTRHFRSVLQTYGISLILYALYLYFYNINTRKGTTKSSIIG